MFFEARTEVMPDQAFGDRDWISASALPMVSRADFASEIDTWLQLIYELRPCFSGTVRLLPHDIQSCGQLFQFGNFLRSQIFGDVLDEIAVSIYSFCELSFQVLSRL